MKNADSEVRSLFWLISDITIILVCAKKTPRQKRGPMFFERRSEPVLPFHLWLQRVVKAIGLAAIVAGVSLGIGVVGYHILGHLSWIDALLEASMILGGEGPIATMSNDVVKLFASAYALFSGLVLLSTMGILLAPWLHRMLHLFHGENGAKTRRN